MQLGWRRRLSRTISDRTSGDELRTLYDARAYILRIGPARCRSKHWQQAILLIFEAASGGDVEAATKQIELALLLDHR
jgi:hypothetical protein